MDTAQKNQLRTGRLMYIFQAALEYLIALAVSGSFLAKLTKEIGMSDSMTGILGGVAALGGVFQLLSMLVRKSRPKKFVIVLSVLNQLLFTTLYLIPGLALGREISTALFALTLASAYLLLNVASPAKTSWLMSMVEPGRRGIFTARKEMFSLLASMIFTFGMGVRGAAIATVISQMCSALWAVRFLTSKKAILRSERLRLDRTHVKKIVALGVSGFFFKFTNSVTQAIVNTTLKLWGGPASTLLIGSMSVINSLREVISMPISGITQGMVPVASYNYGAKTYRRVRKSILFTIAVTFSYNSLAMLLVQLLPALLVGIFTEDAALIETAVPCVRAFYCVYFMMSFQATAQNVFISLNRPKFAVFFSLLRKFVLIAPLTILLPRLGLGAMGVFYAEALSQIIGGAACFTTMMLTVWRELKQKEAEAAALQAA